MSEWKKVTLDQMGIISRGKSKHRPRNDARLFGGKYPFIQTGDIGTAGTCGAAVNRNISQRQARAIGYGDQRTGEGRKALDRHAVVGQGQVQIFADRYCSGDIDRTAVSS